MKKYLMALVAAILIAGIGCKKYSQDYKPPTQPPTEKKWVVRTVAGN
jgi:hypothetical protein